MSGHVFHNLGDDEENKHKASSSLAHWCANLGGVLKAKTPKDPY